MALIAAAVALAALGVYLFIQVRSAPAQVSAPPAPPVVAKHEPVVEQSVTPHMDAPQPQTENKFRPNIPQPMRVGAGTIDPPAPGSDDKTPNLKLDNLMELANKAYDKGDYDEATAIAGKLLSKDPTNVRMLRIIVSANCIQGDSAVAQQYYEKLPKFDREQMKTRCDRYGVTFKEPPQ